MNNKNLSILGMVIAVLVILLLVLYYYDLIPGITRMPTSEEISQVADNEDSAVDEILSGEDADIEQEIPEVE